MSRMMKQLQQFLRGLLTSSRLVLGLLALHFLHVSETKGPPVVKGHESRQVVVRAGDTLRLICPVELDPSLLVEWEKGGEKVNSASWERVRISSDYVLRIKDASAVDQGVYVCRATTGFGRVDIELTVHVLSPDSNDTYVRDTVTSRPYLEKEEAPTHQQPSSPSAENVTVGVGQPASLHCLVRSHARPRIEWRKQPDDFADEFASNTHRYHTEVMLENGLVGAALPHGDAYLCRLTISRAEAGDAGLYTCTCVNCRRPYSSNFLLIVQTDDAPDINHETQKGGGSYSFFLIIVSAIFVFGVLFLATLIVAIRCGRHCDPHALPPTSRSSLTDPTSLAASRSRPAHNGAAMSPSHCLLLPRSTAPLGSSSSSQDRPYMERLMTSPQGAKHAQRGTVSLPPSNGEQLGGRSGYSVDSPRSSVSYGLQWGRCEASVTPWRPMARLRSELEVVSDCLPVQNYSPAQLQALGTRPPLAAHS